MIRYQKINDAELTAANGLPAITVTPEGVAMGAIPDWTALIQPEYLSAGQPLDRVNGVYAQVTDSAVLGAFPNGELGFDLSTDGLMNAVVEASINPNEWSFFSVVEIGYTDSFIDLLKPVANSSEVSPRISHIASTGKIYVYNSSSAGDGSRLISNGTVGSTAALVMVTFSVKNGLKIYLNGALDAVNTTDKRPLTNAYLAGEWAMINRAAAAPGTNVGATGVLGIDLGDQSNVGYRRAIERFLMTKYGILGGQ